MNEKTPFRITIESVTSSRYGSSLAPNESRPLRWEDRISGIDVVKGRSGQTYRLLSDGQQSVPQRGWVLLLTAGNSTTGFTWTLFGMPQGCEVHTY